ncbi:MAG: NAD(P)H-hydrate dehydratase [Candidatus Promineifilaceae bacterium]|nr:NAD(P)H-hydrate dehydratase [Candidatus Promineifilaceae bacterium]
MIKVFSVAEMVAAEKAADGAGVSYDAMMENAGQALADAILERYPVRGATVTVLVGPGNNGGDGLVAGRYLAEAGADVGFYLYRPRDPQSDANYAQLQEMGLTVLTAADDQRYRVLRTRLKISDVVIDALLGTGVDRPIEGELANLMRQAAAGLDERRSILAKQAASKLISVAQVAGDGDVGEWPTARPVVVAVDCPSGLNTDSGALDPLTIAADLTVTFAGPKQGHFKFPGATACGELVVADIGISHDLPEVQAVDLELITAARAGQLRPDRPLNGHKGSFGWVLVGAGASRYWGAPALAGRGAYRVGAGLVALAVPESIRGALATQLPEATYPLVKDIDVLSATTAEALLADMGTYEALLVGPGLHHAAAFIETLFPVGARSDLPPTVVDADGLNLLSELPDWPGRLPPKCLLTPHPGEMARLMGIDVSEVLKQDRIDVARSQAAAWNCVVLLKGAFTVVAAPDGRAGLLPFANPALATAGSGDVLSGILVGLLAQGMAVYEAALLGAYLHGAAAGLAGVNAGLLAGEIADWVPEVLAVL